MEDNSIVPASPNANLLEKLRINKDSAFKHRRRRHPDWTDNYTLYRDKVILNRLTQRQSVNIPLIKQSKHCLKTLMIRLFSTSQILKTKISRKSFTIPIGNMSHNETILLLKTL